MKDYFVPEYHDYRAAVEDYGRRLTAALIDYVENPTAKLEEISERHDIRLATISHNATKFIREEYRRRRGPLPNPAALSAKAREIIHLTREGGMTAIDIAAEVGVSRQYVYDVQTKHRKHSP
jgi:DNA-directed RNA polymerase specialized sigma subunit